MVPGNLVFTFWQDIDIFMLFYHIFRVFLWQNLSKLPKMSVIGHWPGSPRMIYVNLTLNLRSGINHRIFEQGWPLIVCNNGNLEPLLSSTDLNTPVDGLKIKLKSQQKPAKTKTLLFSVIKLIYPHKTLW